MTRDEIVRRTWETLEEHLGEQGYELVEVEFGQHGGRAVLRVFIDCEQGVTLDNCAVVAQLLGPVLDADELVGGSYLLEVSSPGIDRPLRKPGDFVQFSGERVRIQTHVAVRGRKRFKGVLARFEDDLLTVECENEAYDIHIENVAKARLDR